MIVTEDLRKLGVRGEVVYLHHKYARGLYGSKKAVFATPSNLEAYVDPKTKETVQRTPELLAGVANKRAFLNTYWALNDVYLKFVRKSYGPFTVLSSPISKLDIANNILKKTNICVEPDRIVFPHMKQNDVFSTGHASCWVDLTRGKEEPDWNDVWLCEHCGTPNFWRIVCKKCSFPINPCIEIKKRLQNEKLLPPPQEISTSVLAHSHIPSHIIYNRYFVRVRMEVLRQSHVALY
jgi:ribosomal protein L9